MNTPAENRSHAYQGLKVAILAASPDPGAKGGAERLYEGLDSGLRELGCDTELVTVPCKESTFEEIVENYNACKRLDLSCFDVVISTKVPTYAARHPRHVVYLMHTVRAFDDMFEDVFPQPAPEHHAQRAQIHRLDFDALCRVKKRFSISNEVSKRLYRWRGLQSEVLHPPLAFNRFKKKAGQDYFFIPGRLHAWKRIDLLVAAVRLSKLNFRLIIAGTGEAENSLKTLAQGDERIVFTGRISDDELVNLYAEAIGVPFVPIREDYGYVTLEAFASGKPVVTCKDSGEAALLVSKFNAGIVCDPTPSSLCDALEWIYSHPTDAESMGNHGKRMTDDMSWRNTARALLDAALIDTSPTQTAADAAMRVAVVDMQPIEPPIGGGRLRLLGLYHNLGNSTSCHYVGSYDWPGERYRQHALSKTLVEIDIPLSDKHHQAAAELAQKAGGKVVIDLAFSEQAALSEEYLSTVIREVNEAQVVIFSHPWVFPLVKDYLRADQVVIYDSQNVEGYLRAQLLDWENPVQSALIHRVVVDEKAVGERADWILACSHEDLLRFHRLYEFPLDKMRVVPNGVMAFVETAESCEDQKSAKIGLGILPNSFVAIFIGSGYGPNTEAAEFILQKLAPTLPKVMFVIAGGVGQTITSNQSNVVVTGMLDEKSKLRWLKASDIALNPMMSGSGTNIKMFDFMSMGLPTITTAIGARGIDTAGRKAIIICEPNPDAFAHHIEMLKDIEHRKKIGIEARHCVEEGYSWERISSQLGVFLQMREKQSGQSNQLFSVVIPTYERHDQLFTLLELLQGQIERDFEVIIIDQSKLRWLHADTDFGFPVTYFHSPVKGAVRARNTGAMLAQGTVLAFIDDDCCPENDWLLNARQYFQKSEILGLEGKIVSDHLDDPNWRPVTNIGFQGLGFMTANLMIRSSVFQFLGGFDLRFDHPHFREDTDFGWRAQQLGEVSYANDVTVFHPAQPRSVQRESHVERGRFFQKDALLYRKHPERYRELFMTECHWRGTPGFKENLIKGFVAEEITIPEWMSEKLHSA